MMHKLLAEFFKEPISSVHYQLAKIVKRLKKEADKGLTLTPYYALSTSALKFGRYATEDDVKAVGAWLKESGYTCTIKKPGLYLSEGVQGPYRLGKKNNRAVLDREGIEVVIFKPGMESFAKDYVHYLNSK